MRWQSKMLRIFVENETFEVGSASFLNSFFSTVFVRLENGNVWGSRFPVIMNDFYQGKLSAEILNIAIAEINEIRAEFESFSPEKVVWDFEDRCVVPPWGNKISSSITSPSK